MFILDMNKIKKDVALQCNQNDILKLLNESNNMSSNVKIVLGNGLVFVITNKMCTINGFGKRHSFLPLGW